MQCFYAYFPYNFTLVISSLCFIWVLSVSHDELKRIKTAERFLCRTNFIILHNTKAAQRDFPFFLSKCELFSLFKRDVGITHLLFMSRNLMLARCNMFLFPWQANISHKHHGRDKNRSWLASWFFCLHHTRKFTENYSGENCKFNLLLWENFSLVCLESFFSAFPPSPSPIFFPLYEEKKTTKW